MNKIHYIFFIVFLSSISTAQKVELPIYKDSSQINEHRVEDLILRMTLEEKVDLVGGAGFKTKKMFVWIFLNY